jgi:hypothetical protein
MRKHRLCGNDINNYRSQITTGGARGDFMIWWCEQHHDIEHLKKMSTFEINKESHQIRIFLEIHFCFKVKLLQSHF